MGLSPRTSFFAFTAACAAPLRRSRPAIYVSRASRPCCSRLPDLTPSALAKLAEVAELEKGGTAWQNEPRVPAGQPDGRPMDDGGWRGRRARRRRQARGAPFLLTRSLPLKIRRLPLDDGVYRPADRRAAHQPIGGAEEEEASAPVERAAGRFHASRRRVPRLDGCSGPGHSLGARRRFFRASAPSPTRPIWRRPGPVPGSRRGRQTGRPQLSWTMQLLPPGGIDGLTWQERDNLINNLRMERAVAYYTNSRRCRASAGRDAAVLAGTPSTPPTRKP